MPAIPPSSGLLSDAGLAAEADEVEALPTFGGPPIDEEAASLAFRTLGRLAHESATDVGDGIGETEDAVGAVVLEHLTGRGSDVPTAPSLDAPS